ncbi:MAG: DUF4976 domain-containing protein, partial [Bacteroidota bacterium]|nr:DUF4976 domain-containing protein [Bacteroidota bacterium]
NTPFRYYKNYSYEGGINTPMIAHWPGQIAPGTFSRFPGHFIDIMATFVDITGAAYPEEFNRMAITLMQGESLLPAFRGEETARSNALFWEWSQGQAIREDSWKLVKWGRENSWDLYNVSEDPTETNNLATAYPERVQAMEQKFLEWQSKVTHPDSN